MVSVWNGSGGQRIFGNIFLTFYFILAPSPILFYGSPLAREEYSAVSVHIDDGTVRQLAPAWLGLAMLIWWKGGRTSPLVNFDFFPPSGINDTLWQYAVISLYS